MKPILILLGKILRTAALLGLLALVLPRIRTALYAQSRLFTVDTVSPTPVAIVFGAGLWWNGEPTPVLRDRVATAAELYHTGKVSWLLMSGSQSGTYNEPQAMHDYAVGLGVPVEAIVIDDSGDRTYETCSRALSVYNIRHAILVTQRFHLPRAIFTCGGLGMQVTGVEADLREYNRRSLAFWNLRETAATTIAVWQVWVSRPLPVLGDPEPMFPGTGAPMTAS